MTTTSLLHDDSTREHERIASDAFTTSSACSYLRVKHVAIQNGKTEGRSSWELI
jgi:hypothetical protein